jgi:hypothetical protein
VGARARWAGARWAGARWARGAGGRARGARPRVSVWVWVGAAGAVGRTRAAGAVIRAPACETRDTADRRSVRLCRFRTHAYMSRVVHECAVCVSSLWVWDPCAWHGVVWHNVCLDCERG